MELSEEVINEVYLKHIKSLKKNKNEAVEIFNDIPGDTTLYNIIDSWEKHTANHIKYECLSRMPILKDVAESASYFAQYRMRESNGLLFFMYINESEINLERSNEPNYPENEWLNIEDVLEEIDMVTHQNYEGACEYLEMLSTKKPNNAWVIDELAVNSAYKFKKDCNYLYISEDTKNYLEETFRKNSVVSLLMLDSYLSEEVT